LENFKQICCVFGPDPYGASLAVSVSEMVEPDSFEVLVTVKNEFRQRSVACKATKWSVTPHGFVMFLSAIYKARSAQESMEIAVYNPIFPKKENAVNIAMADHLFGFEYYMWPRFPRNEPSGFVEIRLFYYVKETGLSEDFVVSLPQTDLNEAISKLEEITMIFYGPANA